MTDKPPVALITGAARRLGAQTAKALHQRGWNLLIHYRSHGDDADALVAELNSRRPDSAAALQADLSSMEDTEQLGKAASARWGRLDGLVNNASVFCATPTPEATGEDWDRLLHTNLRAPFFLLQSCLPALSHNGGCVVNLIDIYSEKPLADHPLYCASKAGLAALTRAWAKDLAPAIRVNGVSPGAILWPETDSPAAEQYQQSILEKTPLARTGTPADIARTIVFLMCDAPFITGQIVSVDGGRSLNM